MKEQIQMNISANSTTTATETTAQTQTVEKSSASSGSEKVDTTQKAEETKDDKTSEKTNEFKKYLEEPKSTDKVSIEQQNLQNQNQNMAVNEEYINKFGFDVISNNKNFKNIYNFSTLKMSKEDAKFFIDLVENKQYALQQNGENLNLIKFADEIGPTYKTQQTSKVLTDLIAKAYKDGQPVRLDFDNKCSVILKIDSKGKISADFIPADKAVEAYLRNNISALKQRFDEQNLPYNDIMYRQSNQNNRERRQNQQQNKGE